MARPDRGVARTPARDVAPCERRQPKLLFASSRSRSATRWFSHPTVAGLLQLGVVTAELLGQLRKLAKTRTAVLVAFVLEGEHFLDAQTSVLTRLAKWDPPFVEKPNEVLTRDVQQVGRLLRGDLLADGNDGADLLIALMERLTESTRGA